MSSFHVGSSIFADDPADPGHHLGDPGVDPGVLRLRAPNAPGHDPDLGALAPEWAAEEGTAAAAAAWVLVGKAGAEHVAGDTARGWAPVAGFAPVVGPHLHLHLNHKVLM